MKIRISFRDLAGYGVGGLVADGLAARGLAAGAFVISLVIGCSGTNESATDSELSDSSALGIESVAMSRDRGCSSACSTSADCRFGEFCWLSECVRLRQLDAGNHQACAVTTAGSVQCWGSNQNGELGNGHTALNGEPLGPVVGLTSGISDVETAGQGSKATFSHTCALAVTGTVSCWGWNVFGQLGDGTTTDSYVPVAVKGLANVREIGVAALHTCSITNKHGVVCWGANSHGQLGNETTTDSLSPVAVSGLSSGVRSLALGDGGSSCALTLSGKVLCWGENRSGQLGNGTTSDTSLPQQVSGIPPVSALSTGLDHTCAVTTTGALYCWGHNAFGQLGDGTTTSTTSPVLVSGLSAVASVSAGGYFTCAVTKKGAAFCWGSNQVGALGNGSNVSQSLVPIAVSGLSSGVTSVSAATLHACALTRSGHALCWGYNNFLELGAGISDPYFSNVPLPVAEP